MNEDSQNRSQDHGDPDLNTHVRVAWQRVLRADPIEQSDFALAGGSSIDALEMQMALFKKTGRAIDLGSIDEPMCFDGFVSALESAVPVADPGVLQKINSREAPATAAQISQWIYEKSNPSSAAYAVPILVRFTSPVMIDDLSRAIADLVSVHPALRTMIRPSKNMDEFVQIIHPASGVFPVESRGVVSTEEDSIRPIIDELLKTPPSIVRAAPLRAVALQQEGEIRGLLLVCHHAAIDEWSIRVLMQDLQSVLDGDAIPPERLRQVDQAQKPVATEDLAWWEEALADSAPAIPFPSPEARAGGRAPIETVLGPEDVRELEARCAELGVEVAAVVVHAVGKTLGRLLPNPPSKLAIGVPMSLRNDPRLDRSVGMFLNTLPVHVRLDDIDSEAGLKATRQNMHEARKHRFVPLEQLVREFGPRRTDGRVPWLDVMVGFVDRPIPDTSMCSTKVLESRDSPAPLLVVARRENDGSLRLLTQYDDRIVDHNFAKAISESLLVELVAITSGNWKLLDESILVGAETSDPGTLVDIVDRVVSAHPDAIAIESGTESIRYSDLQDLSRRIACSLQANGVSAGDVIGIDCEPGVEFPLGVLGVLRAGCVAMPLAPELPQKRREKLLELSRVRTVLDSKAIRNASEHDLSDKMVGPTSESGCYLLFTSGSTGEPKGVHMSHGSISNFVEFEIRRSSHAARTAMLAPLGFDVVFQEIFSTWGNAGTLVPVSLEQRRDPLALSAFLARSEVTRIHVAPVLLRGIARAVGSAGTPLPHLAEVISAGEELVVGKDLRAMARISGGFQLVNQYGPTETHVATSLELGNDPRHWPDHPSIGTPIDGVTVRVVDEENRVLARGFAGELEVGGHGPAIGYLGEDQDERFTSDEFGRWYRTGDRACIDSSGTIEFLGRHDHQVKISGHRVEPGEIAAVLRTMPGIAECAVVAVPGNETHALWAFVVEESGASLDIKTIEKELRDILPDFMTPRGIDVVEKLPITANGKLDHRSLADLAKVQHVTNRNDFDGGDIHELVARIVAMPAVNSKSSLAELGLDSLGAIRLQYELDELFGIGVPVADLLMTSVEVLQSKMVGSASNEKEKAARKTRPTKVVSGIQRQLDPLERDLIAEVAAAPEGAYHLAWKIEFDGLLKNEWLQEALRAMRLRHASFRTARSASKGASVYSVESISLPRLDSLSSPPTEDLLGEIIRHSLDIENGESIRAATWQEHGKSLVCLVFHHTAIDGRGAEGVIAEFIADIQECSYGRNPVVEENQIQEYVFEERAQDVNWWVSRTRAVIGDQLPDIPRRFGDEGTTHCAKIGVGASFLENAQRYASVQGMPPSAPIIAAWAVLVSQLVGRDRVLIGVPFAVQPTNGASIRLGASLLPLAIDVSGDRALSSIVDDVAGCLALGLENRHAAFGSIAREFSEQEMFVRTPLDAVLTIDAGDRLAGHARVSWVPTGVSPFQAALVIEGEESRSLLAQVEAGLLAGEPIEALSERFDAQLEAWSEVFQQSKKLTVADLPVMSARQARTLDAFETGGPSADIGESIPARFASIASQCPDSPAIVAGETEVSYQQLDAWSGALARRLEEAGVGVGDRVAFMAQRGPGAIAVMLGIARSGGVYVPIDPATPVLRAQEQLLNSKVSYAVIEEDCPEHLSQLRQTICLPPRDACSTVGTTPTGLGLNRESGIYVMFTSGTTGDSKGSLVSHGAVLRLVSRQPFLCTRGPLRMLNSAPLAFDASTLEIWAPLLSGGCISCWEGRGADLVGIASHIMHDQVNAAWLTSALFQAAVDGVPDLFDGLQVVLTGGDVVSAEHVRRIQERCPALVVVNGYGPTENTVFTSCEVIAPGSLEQKDSVSIGRPVLGTTVKIVDESGRRVPLGRVGELVAGGDGVAHGYVAGDHEHRFETTEEGRFYRTGDLARWAPDGRIEFHGRDDAQVKIGGHRIEFGAIEATLRLCPGVADACVASIGEGARRKLIAAVAGEDSMLSIALIRDWLANRLSPAEIPSMIVGVPVMPVTANGKSDRQAVVELVSAAPDVTAEIKGDKELLGVVMDVASDILGRNLGSPTQRLSDAGADSLDMVRISLALEDRLARPVDLGVIIQGGDAQGIASRLRKDIAREADSIVVLRGSRNAEKPAVYCIPGVGGTVFSYESLINAIGPEIPVLGLPYPGLNGQQRPMNTVELLADHFAGLIDQDRTAQVIVGYSLGGFIAFETARRIQQLTGIAPTVLVIDSAPAGLPSQKGLKGKIAIRTELRLRLESVLPPGVVNLLRGRKQAATLESLRNVVAAGFRAVRTYSPEFAALDVLLLRTTATEFGDVSDIEDLGWSRIASKVRAKSIQGRHLEVFRGSTGMDVGMSIANEYARSGRLILQRRQSFKSSSG